MRILSVCETAMGGVGIYQNYLGQLTGPDLALHVLAPQQHRSFLDDDLNVNTFARKRRGGLAIWSMLRSFGRLRHSVKPDLYFFHSTFSLAALMALRLRGDRTPAIYCAHGWAAKTYPEKGWKSRLIQLIEGRLSGLADCVVNVSEDERDLAIKLGYRGRMVVVENAVPDACPDQGNGADLSDSAKVNLLFVGRFDRQKGLDILLEAFAEAGRARSDLRLVAIGGTVRGDGAVLPSSENVILPGWVERNQIDSWYRGADAVIVPSRWEGLPLVIPEAYRNGTPVFCAERSGMEKLVISGKTGDHFPLTVAALCEVLMKLERPALQAMRPAARALYEERFSLIRWRQEILTLMSGLIGKEEQK